MIDSGSSVALSGQIARDRQMDVLANNIANLSTTAFKGEEVMFATLLSTASGTAVKYVQDVGTVRDWSQGPLTTTGNALDVALQGQGFIEVQTAQGIRYTRDGRLKLDSTGQLVTLEGNAVLGDGQSPIAVPAGTTDITIGEDGTLSSPLGTVGKLAVVNFDNLQAVAADADGLYTTDQAPAPATNVRIEQGMIEGSNVQPITEMTRLMQASRAVGMAKTFQDNESDRHKNAIDRLAKTV
jgi:flagellar basal-body rod protein FlgF